MEKDKLDANKILQQNKSKHYLRQMKKEIGITNNIQMIRFCLWYTYVNFIEKKNHKE